jgi:hypothetical protein
MKHIKLFESWNKYHTHIFNDRQEFENYILNWVNSKNINIDDNGDIYDGDYSEYNEETDSWDYTDRNAAYIGSINDDYLIIGEDTFKFDPDYKSTYDWAKEFETYIKGEGIKYVKWHQAQTGTIYINFDNLNGKEYKVRFADHSDAYVNSDFNFAATEENGDGGDWEDLVKWFKSIKSPFLYHATYKPLLKKIKEHGLDTRMSKKAWEDSIPGYVYLALDPEVAFSYAESSEEVQEEWIDNIVILKIDKYSLDQDKLFIDQNVIDNVGDTLEYRGVIPWEYVVDIEDEF